jgi:2-keto-4-pentenoate hydratase/2-oxohepta-3-ene-1,7-dioic acid hydratase in catechol pathway
VPIEALGARSLESLAFSLSINGKVVQAASAADMILSPAAAIVHLSRLFAIGEGDLVFTGTPHGVGPLAPGDELVVTFAAFFSLRTIVSRS